MILWMLWATAVTALLGLAAITAERALRASGRPGRLAWAGAMIGSIAVQAWSLVHPVLPTRPRPMAAPAGTLFSGLPLDLLRRIQAALAPSPSLLRRVDPLVIGAWCVVSALLATVLLVSLLRLRRRARRWPKARVGRGEVLVSEDFGPALLGLRAPRIVFPRWALALGPKRLEMAYAHEDEHRAAGDGWLLLAGVMAATLTPWNPALWWHLRCLRGAAEVDCDRRVLRRGVPPSAYGALLLEVGKRSVGFPFAVAALSRPSTLLERRLTMIVNGRRPGGRWATPAALMAMTAAVAVACQAPAPTGVRNEARTSSATARTLSLSTSVPDTLRVVSQDHPGDTILYLRAGTGDNVVVGRLSPLMRYQVTEDTGRVTVLPDSLHPLVLVDGKTVELSGALHLDPGSIRSINVLKGEMATKRYGARGAHGVILITTKAGGGK